MANQPALRGRRAVDKKVLDRRIGAVSVFGQKDIDCITRLFIQEVMHALIADEVVILHGFGRLQLAKEKRHGTAVALTSGTVNGKFKNPRKYTLPPHTRYRVWFSKSSAFQLLIQEKYGKVPVIKKEFKK